ncbi:MAG: IclR family transcriptional regulator [Oscillospiraceae bacterium]|nr:IclR family transcriptional regulator [Oscillospiraceae bacterium]MBR3185283.1 IclR family transcriptional regulator [Oscillospiraceae bacterium]
MEKKDTAPQSLVRALHLFEMLAKRSAMSVAEISREIGVTRTTTYSLLGPLLELNYIEKDEETGKYRLGYRFYELGRTYRHYFPFMNAADAYAKELSGKVGQQVNVAVYRHPGKALFVCNANMSGQIFVQPESVVSAAVSACGKVLLASLDEETLEEALRSMTYFQFTSSSITDRDALREEIHKVREQGYAEENGELFASRGCIAMPICGFGGRVVAGMSIYGDLDVMKKNHDQYLTLLRDTVTQLSRELGWSGYTI